MRLKSTDVDGDCRYTTSLPLFYFSGLNPNEEEKFVKDAAVHGPASKSHKRKAEAAAGPTIDAFVVQGRRVS